MDITAPISALAEIAPTAAGGADEIYCGCIPERWRGRFAAGALSRRMMGNLTSLEELGEAVTLAHDAGKRLSLTLNQQQYDSAQMALILELAEQFAALGGDALIIADPGLLAAIDALGLGLRLHVSSVAGVRNSQAAKFHQDLGAHRIVFPRYLTLDEMAAVTAAVPELEFEAFVLNDGCLFDEAVCHTLHLPAKMGGAICMDSYALHYDRDDGAALSPEDADRLADNEKAYRRWAWHKFSCGFSTTEDGLPYGPCGLCALSGLARAGVSIAKIAGRESPTERKLKSLEMTVGVRNRLAEPAAAQSFAQALRRRPDYCAERYMCSYPDALETTA
jgi:collagenase-like PrtC family protease